MPVPLTAEELTRHIEVLTTSRDAAELTASACALARSGDRTPTLALARELRSAEFLERLDPPVNGTTPIRNVILIFRELSGNPSEWSGRLCELMYSEEPFRAVAARVNPLLGALAAVTPTTATGAAIFRLAVAEGFAEVVAPLLLRNASPLAIDVFEEMIRGQAIADRVKIEILHRSVLPLRTEMVVLEAARRLLGAGLVEGVREALIETLFDHQSKEWFGPAMHPPEPPAWESAGTTELEFLLRIAGVLWQTALPALTMAAVEETRAEIEAILRGRQQ